MTEIEKGCFLRLFNRGGYVLNFTTDSFDAFTKSSVGVALCARYGLSKGKSLTAYIEEAPPEDASKLLCDLFEFCTCFLCGSYSIAYRSIAAVQ